MSQIDTVFEYNGAQYSFDVRDADDAEKFENAINGLAEDEKAAQKDGKISEHIRLHCNMLKRFFDTCLGEGAGEKICGIKSNITVHYEAYDKFIMFIKEQRDDILSAKSTFAKYSNRSQRRAAQKQKPKK